MPEHSPHRIGVFGAGTVGLPFIEDLQSPVRPLNHKRQPPLKLVGIVRRNRQANPELAHLYTTPEELIRRSDIVVELMGGVRDALDVILDALRQGKSVVTANKAVVAQNFLQLREEARSHGATIRYNAAVGGGTDMLSPLNVEARIGIESIRAIINGTCNSILTGMEEGKSYDAALAEAKKEGLAETNPAMDVEGHDAKWKLAILAWHAFGIGPRSYAIPTQGITGISSEDMRDALAKGMTWKHIVEARRVPGDDRALVARVGPVLEPVHSRFGGMKGPYNCVEVNNQRGRGFFYCGPGAGGPETAEVVLSDVIRIIEGPWDDSPFKEDFQRAHLKY